VAQLARARGSGLRGRQFKSAHPDQLQTSIDQSAIILNVITKKRIANLFIILGVCLITYSFLPFLAEEIYFQVLQWQHKKYVLVSENEDINSPFGKLLSDPSVFGKILSSNKNIGIRPVNKDFSLVIEKIGVNAPVVMGVSVSDKNKYTEALKSGVAHAIVSDLPSPDPGNVYLFAHTSFNYWSLGKYATTFNLLRKLETKDEINVFYHNKRYVYEVINKEILPGWNTYPLTRAVIEPILTLQTCDPPGTTINRLVVTAKLKKIVE
jgi:LPXTG-site transpeptidase (sortase) family protein